MDHPQALGLMQAYFDGSLDRATVRELHAHLKDCEDCRSRIRLRKAGLQAGPVKDDRGLASPELQAQMARNRELLIKILALLVLAWAVWKYRR